MSRPIVIVLVLIAFGVGIAVGVAGILRVTAGDGTPSQEVSERVPTLSLDGPTATPAPILAIGTEIADLNAKVDSLSTQVGELEVASNNISEQVDAVGQAVDGIEIAAASAVEVEPTPMPTLEPTIAPTEEASEPTEDPAADEAASGDVPERALYRITDEESEARFLIDEILLGEEIVVVGITDDVAGDVIVNFADPAASQLGQISVSARTLKTDQEFRDQSIRGQILESSKDEFEFIDFVPTSLLSLASEPVSMGETVSFEIVGDLTIKGATLEETFQVDVTVVDEDRIEGFATTTVLYADYGITIQQPPSVAGIGEVVTLEIDFVALRVDE